MTVLPMPSRRTVRAQQEREERARRRRPSAVVLATVVTLRAFLLRGLTRTTNTHVRLGLEAIGCGFFALAAFQLTVVAGLAVLGLGCWIISWRVAPDDASA